MESIEKTDRQGVLKAVLSYQAGTRYIRLDSWDILNPYASVVPKPTPQPTVKRHRYFQQSDNKRCPLRTCFSSSVAMLISYHKPDALVTDDDYVDTVLKLGCTTEAQTQLMALREYGLTGRFEQNWGIEKLQHAVSGKHAPPIAFGWIHRGTPHGLIGGGHWSVCHGFDYNTDEFLVDDPYLSNFCHQTGEYKCSKPGQDQRFSVEMMQCRWEVDGPGTGWVLFVGSDK